MLMVDMAHIAGLVAAGLHPIARAARRLRHHDHAQDAARPARRHDPLQGASIAKAIDSAVFPGIQGGPLDARHRRQGGRASARRCSRSSRHYQQQIVDNAQALAEALTERGFRLVSGGTDNHLMLVDLRPKRLTGKVAEEALDRAGITVNKNIDPVRPARSRSSPAASASGTPA